MWYEAVGEIILNREIKPLSTPASLLHLIQAQCSGSADEYHCGDIYTGRSQRQQQANGFTRTHAHALACIENTADVLEVKRSDNIHIIHIKGQ